MTGSRLAAVLLLLGCASLLPEPSDCQNDYLDDYFDKVVASFYQKLVENGVSSLPVKDVTLSINRTLNPEGLHLEGNVSYTGGAVIEIEELFKINDGHRGDPEENSAHLFYQIDFPNMTIVADVEAHTTVLGSGRGTAEIFFPNSTIGATLDVDYATGKKSVQLEIYSTSGAWTNFQPSTDLMDAIARLGRLELGSRMLWDQMAIWCGSVFHTLLDEAVQEEEFPIIPPVYWLESVWEGVQLFNDSWEDPEIVYVREIAKRMDEELQVTSMNLELQEYGQLLNRTILGVPLNGQLRILNGFSPSFGIFRRTDIAPTVVPGGPATSATIHDGISVTNLTLVYDLEANLDAPTGTLKGSVEVSIPLVDLLFQMVHTFSTEENVVTDLDIQMFEVAFNFEPESQPIQAIRLALADVLQEKPWFLQDLHRWHQKIGCPLVEQKAQGLKFPIRP